MTISASDRIMKLKQEVFAAASDERRLFRRAVAARVFGEHPDEPQTVKVARFLEAFLREKELLTFDGDLLAGYSQRYYCAVPGIDENPSKIPANKYDPLRPWENDLPEQVQAAFAAGLYSSCPGAHHIPGHERVLKKGFGGLAADARKRLETAEGEARDFARASLIVCEAATEYVLRYAQMFEESADKTPDAARIAEACRWVATNPARTFFEALQLLWLSHELIVCEQGNGAMSLGRFDQYLFPYYERDCANGTMTPDEAQELILAMWVKFGGAPQTFQHVTLGGLTQNGDYLANDLTYMALRASQALRMDQPLIGLRYHPSMPDAVWNEAQKLIELGTGFPAFFNDRICIEAKMRQDIPYEEAVEYANIGCVEMSMPGREYAHTESFRINWVKVLELMLNRGTCPESGEKVALLEDRDPDSVETFEEFFAWYKRELLHAADVGTAAMDVIDANFPKYKPTPFASSTCEGCLEKGKDVSDGGTIWNFSTFNVTGQGNTVDALTAIKHLVYQEKCVSFAELAAILRQNFAGYEGLRKKILAYPKYGNDHDEPDTMLVELMSAFSDRVSKHVNPRGGRFTLGLFTAGWHALLGKLTGASPDGRLANTALCSGSSPVQGADNQGPTAAIRSVTKLDHACAGNGLVFGMKFHPAFFDDDDRKRVFRNLVETYLELGGMEMQVNVLKRETLLDAQKHPEKHRNLLVRVSGFSAYFVDLDRVVQNEIIARTEVAAL